MNKPQKLNTQTEIPKEHSYEVEIKMKEETTKQKKKSLLRPKAGALSGSSHKAWVSVLSYSPTATALVKAD